MSDTNEKEKFELFISDQRYSEPACANSNHSKCGKRRHIYILRKFITGGNTSAIHETATDVNKDGKVNVKDVIMIRHYITGGYGVEL